VKPPNPVWLREMRQAARLRRTPLALATLTALTALIVASAGGVASTSEAPAAVGTGLYHTFFSLAFAVVAWVGPGVAAMTIASERSGRTWEALLLTGLDARTIARGKFLASLTYIGLYLVALAPVGAVPFLFGGVTAFEVFIAFGLLVLFSALAVGFGLSVSSSVASPGLAAVVTLPIAVVLSITAYSALGVGLSFVAHGLWPGVVQGAPVWLPTAYARAPFSAEYLVYLLFIPLGVIGLLAWFFFENTVANLQDPSDDRASGLKRWYLVSVPAFTAMAIAVAAVVPDGQWAAILGGIGAVSIFALLSLFLFAADVLEPTPRVLATWARTGRRRFARMLGPGIVGTMTLVMVLALASFAALAVAGIAFERHQGTGWSSPEVGAIIVLSCYAAAFLVFLGGFCTWVRSMVERPISARLLLLLAGFVAVVGPWLALAITSTLFDGASRAMAMAAPSPAYAAIMIDALESTSSESGARLLAGAVAMGLWTVTGLVLHALGARRAERVSADHRVARAALEGGTTPTSTSAGEPVA
jgi:hypothetical protein